MRKAWVRSCMTLVALFLAAAAVAQEQEIKPQQPDLWRCDGCVSKVIQLPASSKPTEMQDVVNLFRTVVELRILKPEPWQHTISVTCTPEQLAVVDKIVSTLDELRESGDRRRSIVIWEPANPPMAEELTSSHQRWEPELSLSYIKAFYLPDVPALQMMQLTNNLRKTTQIQRMQMLPSAHVIVIRGSSEKMAQADRVMSE